MSPEQAAGAYDRLGPASDVYSLGATLYSLLTGHAPVEAADLATTLDRVRRGDFPRPAHHKPDLTPALEAICLKAMALRPEDRYASPRALADDVEHWLADEPVSAHREGLWPRLGRWARRHRPLVAGAAALLVTSVVALAVGLWRVRREQARTETRRLEAVAAKHDADLNAAAARKAERLADQRAREAVAARNDADRNATAARKAEALAEQRARIASERFTLALDAFGTLVFNVQERLENTPATQKVRLDLLQTALKGLDALIRNAERTGAADHTLIVAQLRSGDIALLLGQTAKARDQYDRGRKIAEALAKADPDNAGSQMDVLASEYKSGMLGREVLEHANALTRFERALAILNRLQRARKPEDAPDLANYRRVLEDDVEICRAAARAIEDADSVRAQPAARRPELLAARVVALAGRGRRKEAAAAAELIRDLDPRDPDHLVMAARCFSRLAAPAPAGADPADGERYAARAVALLTAARDAGGLRTATDRDRLRLADEYAPLQSRPDFQALLRDLSLPSGPDAFAP
jgi:tetratricopeptide (TPR) repeat protein